MGTYNKALPPRCDNSATFSAKSVPKPCVKVTIWVIIGRRLNMEWFGVHDNVSGVIEFQVYEVLPRNSIRFCS